MALLDMRAAHKAIYLLLIIALMCIENRAINKDRADLVKAEDDRRREENTKFAGILEEGRKHFAASLAENQREFAETLRRSDRIIAGVGDSVNMQTGGDSFAYITLTGPMSPIITVDKFSNPSAPWMLVSVTSHGKYPLKNIHAYLMDDERRLAAIQEYNKHPDGDWMKAIQSGDTEYQYAYLRPQSAEAPSGEAEPIGAYPVPQGNSKRLSIHFSSLNGDWNETLHLGLVNSQWHQCLSILGPTVKQSKEPFIWCDSDWPEGKILAEKDWADLKPPSH